MKEEMEKLMQEEDNLSLEISCSQIQQTLENGEITGTFSFRSTKGKNVKGKIIVSDPRVECKETSFQDEMVEISYYFNGSDMEPEEVVSGSFVLLTNLGEYEIPFEFSYPKEELSSSLGEIKNLFHFTNLARTNWAEACKLYFSKEFKDILKNADREYTEIYRGLSGKVREQYMDEFLHAIHKKAPISYETKTQLLKAENIYEPHCMELSIEKSGWGYVCLSIETEGDFLSIEKKKILEEDFKGNVYRLPVYIDVKKLHQGKNWGEIVISSNYDTIKVPVLVSQNQHHRMRTAMEKRKNAKWLNSKLTNLYIHFRNKNIAAMHFKKESEEILDALQKSDERNPLTKLYGAHLYITQEKYHEAKWLLDRAVKNIQEEAEPIIYAYYLYLTTLITKDKEYVARIKEKIEQLYFRYDDVWQIAWLWMYLSKELHGSAQKKWNFLREVFVKGCTSPVMYTEALLLLNYQPTLLMELGEVELRVLRFGQKHGMLSEQINGIVQYLALKEKEFSKPVYELLTAMGRESEHPELLQAICSLLIKGNKIGKQYFIWYEKAILAEIKITRLYEYYMMSLDQEKTVDIPRMVLLYFSYQTDLSTDYAAYLYRYIYDNRESLEDLYFTYVPSMERYLLKKLYAGKINRDLGYLYEEIILPKMMTEDNAKALAKVMFTHSLTKVGTPGEKIIVVYSQLEKEEEYSCGQKETQIQLYNKGYSVFKQDKDGNRFLLKEEQLPISYMNIEKTSKYIRAWVQEDLGLALYLCDGDRDWQNITPEREAHFKYLSTCDRISSKDRLEIQSHLLDYFFETDRMEKLDDALEELIPYSVVLEERRKLIHYLVVRGFHQKAYDFTRIYGPEKIETKDLVRIASYMLEENSGEKEILEWYIITAFKKGKYNSEMLKYLIDYYQGSSKEMKNIFMAARNFGMDTFSLCERLLMQILTTKADIGDETEIFKVYVARESNTQIEAAFLTYRAVEYMKEDREISLYLISDIGRVYRKGCQMPLVTHLAYLRYFAENTEEREHADETILQEFLQEIVIEKEMLLPFIREYINMPGMEALADKTFISYKTKPKSRVVIHYLKKNDSTGREGYRREEMKEVYFGVYIKEFVLFYGEELQYYITEEQENQEQLTENGTILKEEEKEDGRESRYRMINEMAIGQNLQDYSCVKQALKEYWQTEFVADKVFKL